MSLSKTLRALRKRQALTQAELAERSGVSARTIGEIESGVQLNPRSVTLRLLLEALGVDENERGAILASLRDVPNSGKGVSLPTPAYELIGRHAECRAIELALTRDERLITLVGPGGVGKTALAIDVGRRVEGALPGPTVFIDAQAAQDFSTVRNRVLAALDLPVEPTAILRSQPASLVIIDNFEHLCGDASALAALAQDVPFARFMITSREHLRLRMETVVPIEPLALASALALFEYHARRLQLADAWDRHDDARIRAICTRLDCLPLAIELAVPRLRFLSLEALTSQLSADSGALATSNRDVPQRHRSIREAIDTSYRLLTDDERFALRALATFRGGTSVAGLAAMLERSVATAHALVEELALKSLVRVTRYDDHSRVDLLETIREFVTDRARELGELPMLAERHARRTHAARHEHVALERDNVRTAIAWSIAHGASEIGLDLIFAEPIDSSSDVGPRRRALDALLGALDASSPRATELRVRGAWTRGWYAYLGNDYAVASACFDDAVRVNADSSERWGLNLLDPQFLVLFALGDYERALELGRAAVAERRRSLSSGLSCTLTNVGVVALFTNRIDEAGTYFSEAARVDERTASRNLSSSMRNLAVWAVRSGDTEAAIAYARLCEAALPPDRPMWRMHLEIALSEIALASNTPLRAFEHLSTVLDLGGDFANNLVRQDACFAVLRIAEAFALLDRPNDAKAALRLTLDLYELWAIRIHPAEERRIDSLTNTIPRQVRGPVGQRPLRSEIEVELANIRSNVASALARSDPRYAAITSP